MSLPTEKHIEILRGTDNFLEFQIKDLSGKPINIEDDILELTVKDGLQGTLKLGGVLTSPAGSHKDAGKGIVEFLVPRDQVDDETSSDSETVWRYEVRRRYNLSATEYQFVHYNGKFKIKPSL